MFENYKLSKGEIGKQLWQLDDKTGRRYCYHDTVIDLDSSKQKNGVK